MKNSPRLIGGQGINVRLRRTPGRTMISFAGRPADFSHPWQVSFFADSATFLPGMVNRHPATIGGITLDGSQRLKDDGGLVAREGAAPLLEVEPMLDAEGRGWFCVEVTVNPEKEWGVVTAEMVQVAEPDTADGRPGSGLNAIGGAKPLPGAFGPGTRARHPVAMLRRRSGGSFEVFANSYSHLQLRIAFAVDRTPQRYFFAPV